RDRSRLSAASDRHDPCRLRPLGRGGDPGRRQGLCHELPGQQRVGDRHGDGYTFTTFSTRPLFFFANNPKKFNNFCYFLPLLSASSTGKLSNGVAGLAAGGSSSDRKRSAANSCLLGDAA